MNKVTKYLFLVFIILVLVMGVYWFFTRTGETETEETNTKGETINTVIMEKVFSPSLSFSGDTMWFFDQKGKLFSLALDEEGNKKEFILPEIVGFEAVEWQPNESNFIVKQNLNGHSKYSFYDAEFRNLVEYPEKLTKPTFSFREKIVYEWITGEEKNQLQVSDLTSKEFRAVTDLFRADYKIVASQAKNEVVLFTENQLDPTKIFLVNLDTAQFQDLSVPLAIQGASFSPDGSKLLVARWDQENSTFPSLYIQDLDTKDLFIPGLFANIEQTVWSEDGQELYIVDSSGIKKLDINSNQVLDLYDFQEDEDYEPADLLLHPNRQSLFFINKKTGYLYRVKL